MKNAWILFLCSCNVFAYNELQVQTVLQHAKAGKIINGSRCDFRGSGSLLQTVNFNNSYLSGALFDCNDNLVIPTVGTIKVAHQITNLTGVNFSGAELVSTSFKNVNLTGSNFNGADIAYADFAGANLKEAQFSKVKNISLARFCGATMPDGSVLSSGTWASPSGQVFNAYCSAQ